MDGAAERGILARAGVAGRERHGQQQEEGEPQGAARGAGAEARATGLRGGHACWSGAERAPGVGAAAGGRRPGVGGAGGGGRGPREVGAPRAQGPAAIR